jgi:isocitrate lyase
LHEARKFAEAIHAKFPGKMLAYNCSPSFNWKKNLDDATIAKFQRELGGDGLQVPVHHAGRASTRSTIRHVQARARLPRHGKCRRTSRCRRPSSPPSPEGHTATKHQREVGAGYSSTTSRKPVTAGQSSVTAMKGST